jgi:type IV pilus assembly protein PilW
MTEEAKLSAMSRRPARSAGFSLIEILVGVGIGMIGILVIMQVFTLSEGQRRTTSTGGDAQTTGAIALYTMERDIRQGGYGMASLNLLGCNVTLPNGPTVPAAPVTINPAGIPAGDANTDVVAVFYGNANAAIEGDFIVQQPAATTYTVRTPSNFTSGDFVIAEPSPRPNPCNLTLAQIAAPPTPTTVTVNTGQAGAANGTLFDLGQQPRVLVYAVRNGNLTQCDFTQNNCTGGVGDNTVWSPVAENIVSLRAEYGRDTSGPPMDGIADVYDQTTPATACAWVRASALRIALVARAGQYDKNDVTTTAPTWAGSATTPIDLTADGNWQHYRYKTFQTVVPLRNVAWMGVQSGC